MRISDWSSDVCSSDLAGRGEQGTLRIGVFTSLAGGFLRDLVLEFRNDHPLVHIDVREGDRRVHISEVRRHSLDVVIATGNAEVIGCDTAELWQERVHVALPQDHRSEEHTSELQSLMRISYAVFCLKKKK